MRKKRRRGPRLKRFKFKAKLNSKVIRTILLFLFAAVLVGGLVYAISTLEIFKIKEEDIRSNIPLTKNLKNEIIGQSLFTIDIEPISARLLSENPGYKKIYVVKKFPSFLIIDGKKRGFFAQLKAKQFYPLDAEGVVLSDGKLTADDHLIPIEISSYNNFFKKGDVIDDVRLKRAFNLIEVLGKENFLSKFTVTSINATNLDATYFFIDSKYQGDDKEAGKNIKIIIGDSDFKQRIDFLEDIINQELQDKMSLVDYIDLRHKKVYVGFKR
jgi:cell division septal protein FtsQ